MRFLSLSYFLASRPHYMTLPVLRHPKLAYGSLYCSLSFIVKLSYRVRLSIPGFSHRTNNADKHHLRLILFIPEFPLSTVPRSLFPTKGRLRIFRLCRISFFRTKNVTSQDCILTSTLPSPLGKVTLYGSDRDSPVKNACFR